MRRYLILATVIVMVVGAGIAVAQVGDGGVIHACAKEKGGDLRLVDSQDDCTKKERSVSWNQQGVPGDDGVDGEDGLPGQPGSDGDLALADQVCVEEGASVIGFDDAGDIICQVGGATTTTTTTLPPDHFDLNGEWTVTESHQHACGDVAPSVGSTINVIHGGEPFEIWWETSEGSWHFEATGVPFNDHDLIGAGGWIFDPNDQHFEANMGADRGVISTGEAIYVSSMFEWAEPACVGAVDFTATR